MAKLKKTILIAEDEASSRALLREILTQAGYNVLEAQDGIQAFDVLGKQKPDMLITDRMMPGMNGLDLLKKMKDKKMSVPSVMISAYGEESLWGQAVGFGAQDYLLKPYVPEQVLQVVRKILKEKTS